MTIDRFRTLACPVCRRTQLATDQRIGVIAVYCKECRDWRVFDLSKDQPGSAGDAPPHGRLRQAIETAHKGV